MATELPEPRGTINISDSAANTYLEHPRYQDGKGNLMISCVDGFLSNLGFEHLSNLPVQRMTLETSTSGERRLTFIQEIRGPELGDNIGIMAVSLSVDNEGRITQVAQCGEFKPEFDARDVNDIIIATKIAICDAATLPDIDMKTITPFNDDLKVMIRANVSTESSDSFAEPFRRMLNDMEQKPHLSIPATIEFLGLTLLHKAGEALRG